MKRLFAAITAGLLALGAASPSPGNTASDAEVQTLRERAAAYWAARMTGDDKVQWDLLEPRGRGRVTPQEYATERRGIQYLGYQIETASIDGFFAVVKVRLLFQVPQLASVAPQTVLMDDRWVRVGGAWYRQLDERKPQKAEP